MNFVNKKVLVTGADGFIGSHLTELLVQEGANVKALAQYNSFNFWGWLEDVSSGDKVEVITGDIRDPHFCKKITKNIDIIFHLAALIAIPFSYVAPQSYFETNSLGTLNICQAALENNCQRIIHTSTSEVYGTARYVPIDEKHPLQAQSPYSASKISADAIVTSYYNSFNLPAIISRPFNTYGPRQSARAVIPTIIIQLLNNKKEIKLGDTTPTRDLNYVEDTCNGLLSLADCDKALGEVVNIGSNSEISIREVFQLLNEILKRDSKIVSDEQRIRPLNSEVYRLKCDNKKLKELTGFKPKYDLLQGFQKTINWFSKKENLSKYKEGIYNV